MHIYITLIVSLILSDYAFAGEVGKNYSAVNTLWVLIAAFMVFFMQAGFGMVEAGLIRAKNAINILMKNFLDFIMASLGFFVFGYAIMFGSGNDFFGYNGFFMLGAENPTADIPVFVFWMFQAVFCGTAATIVVGGVAERMKFVPYLIYSFLISAFFYPIIGHWVWGGGWLAKIEFHDFAGSTMVHAVGGFAALVGTVMLKPRIGKYKNGEINIIAGHNMPMVALGVFILWFGWFGFNPGSALGMDDPELIGRVTINTDLAAGVGGLFAMILSWLRFGKPDVPFTLNGILAGLVSITAPCAVVEPISALIIGSIGGMISVFGFLWLDNRRIDDPVGAIPVHGFCGVWGTLAVGLWGVESYGSPNDGLFYGGGFLQLGIQSLGTVSCVLAISLAMYLTFLALKHTIGIRVSEKDESKGSDLIVHGINSYHYEGGDIDE